MNVNNDKLIGLVLSVAICLFAIAAERPELTAYPYKTAVTSYYAVDKVNGIFVNKKDKSATLDGGRLSFAVCGEKSVGVSLDKSWHDEAPLRRNRRTRRCGDGATANSSVACEFSADESDWSTDNLVWSDEADAYVAADATQPSCFARLSFSFNW